MTIEYQCTKDDYKNFIKAVLNKRLHKNAFVLVVFPLIIGGSYAGDPFSWIKFFLATALSTFLMMVVFFLVPYLMGLRKINKLISKKPQYLEKVRLTLSDEGLLFELAEETMLRKWESFISAECSNDNITMNLVDNAVLLIPKRAFTLHADFANFLGIVQKKIVNERGKANDMTNLKKDKPPYMWGLFCLIPFFGAMAGIVFAILGLTRYKDKWFTLIGLSGILFTAIVYFVIVFTMKDMQDYGTASNLLAQSELNNLVEHVEYYKVLNGQYPDSLQQLVKINSMVMINDPIQIKHTRRNSEFKYERVNDKYRLFSSGEDGIPDTNDDLYPQLSETEINKTGWIKSHF